MICIMPRECVLKYTVTFSLRAENTYTVPIRCAHQASHNYHYAFKRSINVLAVPVPNVTSSSSLSDRSMVVYYLSHKSVRYSIKTTEPCCVLRSVRWRFLFWTVLWLVYFLSIHERKASSFLLYFCASRWPKPLSVSTKCWTGLYNDAQSLLVRIACLLAGQSLIHFNFHADRTQLQFSCVECV